jgi:hypothetical protein
MAGPTSPTADQLTNHSAAGFQQNFDWKGEYVSSLAEDGYERFSQYSATPDSTLLLAGPARYSGVGSATTDLIPIGLADGISYQSSPQLQRLFEIGSNRAFFTRGKTMSSISFSKILADQKNILNALTQSSYRPGGSNGLVGGQEPGVAGKDMMMNLDSEYFAVPFGLLLLFKTRGGSSSTGKVLGSIYLEYCMFANYQFNVASQSPVIMENIALEFDRSIPVDFA